MLNHARSAMLIAQAERLGHLYESLNSLVLTLFFPRTLDQSALQRTKAKTLNWGTE